MTGLPPALDGLRLGLITDIHHSNTVAADDVARAVALLHAAQPDLIVLGGDYVTFGDRSFVEPVGRVARTAGSGTTGRLRGAGQPRR